MPLDSPYLIALHYTQPWSRAVLENGAILEDGAIFFLIIMCREKWLHLLKWHRLMYHETAPVVEPFWLHFFLGDRSNTRRLKIAPCW